MKIKTIDVTVEGKTVTVAVLDDKGLPIYVHDNGAEIGFDAPQATAKITQLNGEAKTHREAKEAAELKLKPFEGIEDAAAALAALETVKNISTGDLTTAAKVQEIKDNAKKAAEEQVAAAIKASDERTKTVEVERDGLKSALDNELIGGGFSRSKYIADKIAIPADIMQATFGKAFKVEEGKLVGYDAKGVKIFSRVRPGDDADLDEALEVLVGEYPNREHILKGGVGPGGGAPNPGGVHTGATIQRAAFLSLPPAEQAAKSKDVSAGKLKIVDA